MKAPAETDPDLVVVLGAAHCLPRSLVWELAYSELVFLEVAWSQLSAAHLVEAIDSFAHRHRRFGGID
jgi:undecaprenyl diphosphate synthase